MTLNLETIFDFKHTHAHSVIIEYVVYGTIIQLRIPVL